MDLYQAQDFFKQMFPDKLVTFTFDEKCFRFLECVITEGLPNIMHHIEYNKVRVDIPDQPSQYIPIDPHRKSVSWSSLKNFISQQNDVFIGEPQLKEMRQLRDDPSKQMEWNLAVADLRELTGLTVEQIDAKVSSINPTT